MHLFVTSHLNLFFDIHLVMMPNRPTSNANHLTAGLTETIEFRITIELPRLSEYTPTVATAAIPRIIELRASHIE